MGVKQTKGREKYQLIREQISQALQKSTLQTTKTRKTIRFRQKLEEIQQLFSHDMEQIRLQYEESKQSMETPEFQQLIKQKETEYSNMIEEANKEPESIILQSESMFKEQLQLKDFPTHSNSVDNHNYALIVPDHEIIVTQRIMQVIKAMKIDNKIIFNKYMDLTNIIRLEEELDLGNTEQVLKLIKQHSIRFKYLTRIQPDSDSKDTYSINHIRYENIKIEMNAQNLTHYLMSILLAQQQIIPYEEVLELLILMTKKNEIKLLCFVKKPIKSLTFNDLKQTQHKHGFIYLLLNIMKLVQTLETKGLKIDKIDSNQFQFDENFQMKINDLTFVKPNDNLNLDYFHNNISSPDIVRQMNRNLQDLKLDINQIKYNLKHMIFGMFDQEFEISDSLQEVLETHLKLLQDPNYDIHKFAFDKLLIEDLKKNGSKSVVQEIYNECSGYQGLYQLSKVIYQSNPQNLQFLYLQSIYESQYHVKDRNDVEQAYLLMDDTYSQLLCKKAEKSEEFRQEFIQSGYIFIKLCMLKNIDYQGHLIVLAQYIDIMNDQQIMKLFKYSYNYFSNKKKYLQLSILISQCENKLNDPQHKANLLLHKVKCLNFQKKFIEANTLLQSFEHEEMSDELKLEILLCKLHQLTIQKNINYNSLLQEIKEVKKRIKNMTTKKKISVKQYIFDLVYGCKHFNKAIVVLDKILKLSVQNYTESSPETLDALVNLNRLFIYLLKLDQARATFKKIILLKPDIHHYVPQQIIEQNRVNKALYYLAKMKYSKCREAIKEINLSENQKYLEDKLSHALSLNLSNNQSVNSENSQGSLFYYNYKQGYYFKVCEKDAIQPMSINDYIYYIKCLLKLNNNDLAEVAMSELMLLVDTQLYQLRIKYYLKIQYLKLFIDYRSQRLKDYRLIDDRLSQIDHSLSQNHQMIHQVNLKNQILKSKAYYKMKMFERSEEIIINMFKQSNNKIPIPIKASSLRILVKNKIKVQDIDSRDVIQDFIEQNEGNIEMISLFKLYYTSGKQQLTFRNLHSAFVNLNKSLQLFKEIYGDNKLKRLKLYQKLATCYRMQRHYDNSISCINEILDLSNHFSDEKLTIKQSLYKGQAFLEMGHIRSLNKQFQEALVYYEQAFNIFDKTKSINRLYITNLHVETLISLGYCKRMCGDYLSALGYGRIAEQEYENHNEYSDVPYDNIQRDRMWTKLICFLGRMLILQKEYQRAINYYQQLCDFLFFGSINADSRDKRQYEEMTDQEVAQLFSCCINMGSCYFALKQYQPCKEAVELGLDVISSRVHCATSQQISKAYENLGKVCEKLGHFEESVRAYQMMIQLEVNIDDPNDTELITTNQNDNSLMMFRDNQSTSQLSKNFMLTSSVKKRDISPFKDQANDIIQFETYAS